MNSSRLTSRRIGHLIDELPARYVAPLPHLAQARLLTGAHLDRLLTQPDMSAPTTGRVRRRVMARLTGLGLVATLERRIGGVRAGSTGHIYTLTPAGRVFLAVRDGMPRPPRQRHANRPGWEFLAHALAISEIYVHLTETARVTTGTAVKVSTFVTEPGCWFRNASNQWIRPDAYVLIATPLHADCWWLEIDRDTESPARIAAKCRAYTDHLYYGGTGPHGAPPRILFSTPTSLRCRAISGLIAKLPHPDDQLFETCVHAVAGGHLIAALLDQSLGEGTSDLGH